MDKHAVGSYTDHTLQAIYELGRLYFDMGYFVPAERIFGGLANVDQGTTPARVGLGLIKLEAGLYEESVTHFRDALEKKEFEPQAKLGLAMAFLALGEDSRARWIVNELKQKRAKELQVDSNLGRLTDCLLARLDEFALLEKETEAQPGNEVSAEDESSDTSRREAE